MHIYANEVETVYTAFAKNLTKFKKGSESITLVITIPVWLKYDISISQAVLEQFTSL
jgi:hypothetical protein